MKLAIITQAGEPAVTVAMKEIHKIEMVKVMVLIITRPWQ
jgi:hypothetical protein